MTSRKLTFGFNFWSCGHLRMAVTYLPTKFGADIFLSNPELLTFFRNSRRRPPPSWSFKLREFITFQHIDGAWALYQVSFKYMLWSLRLTHLCSRCDVTRINFRFRLLVTWSSPHGHNASSHHLWCKDLYLIRSYWHFPRIQDGRCPPHLICWGAAGPPTKAHSCCVPPAKISSWSAK